MYTLIGDLVGSRRLADRPGVQRRLSSVLDEVNAVVPAVQSLEPTVGDEYQGGFDSLAKACLAGLLVRLAMIEHVDVRCGLGVGEVTVHDPSRRPLLQDGPGWWAAREALEKLATPARSGARTWYVGPDAWVQPFLLTRDALVDRFSDRGRRMLRLALLGQTQQQIAALEGISASAVSQQFARGIAAVRDAHAMLAENDPEET
ncbi:SatD family protein [Nocardioides limicola]|uniref:SatD family protein n=1 Tax=Nocardioides limicola TaxID=2803368 RepID=UPI00193BC910|nr:SatD family protein [Nocardioides sp. DJM-14]